MTFYLPLFASSPARLPPLHFSLNLVYPRPPPSIEPVPSKLPSQVNTECSPPGNNCNYLDFTKKSLSEETLVNRVNNDASSDEDILTTTNEMTSIANSLTTDKSNGLIESDIPSSEKILSSENVVPTLKEHDGAPIEHADTRSVESVSTCTDMPTANRIKYARLNNGFVADIPDSILKRRGHIMNPYGDLLRVVLSNALTYVTDLQDIMRGEIALRFPLAPFDSRPAYMRYVRCGELMLKELETRTESRCLPPITKRAWKSALAIASNTRESPDFQVSFHPQELGLDYDEYKGEHPRDFLARSLMILADHPTTRGILLGIAQEFAASQYDSSTVRNVSLQQGSHSLGVDVRHRDVVDTGFAVTKGKNPRPYEIETQKLVVRELRQVIQKLARKLQECARGTGCVQLGSSEVSKIIDRSVFTETQSMDNLWNVTMQVTALQTNSGPVNYTTSYLSTSPSAVKNSPSWESNLAEMDDSIFGPNLSFDAPPQNGWGITPNIKDVKYHYDSADASPAVSSKERTEAFQDPANEWRMIGSVSEKEVVSIGSCEGRFDGQSVCQEIPLEKQTFTHRPVKIKEPPTIKQEGHPNARTIDAACQKMAKQLKNPRSPIPVTEHPTDKHADARTAFSIKAEADVLGVLDGPRVCPEMASEQEKIRRIPVKGNKQSTAKGADDPTKCREPDVPSFNGKVPAISSQAIRSQEYFNEMYEKQPAPKERSWSTHGQISIPKKTQALDTVASSDEEKSERTDRRNSIPEITQALDTVASSDEGKSESSDCRNSIPKTTQALDTVSSSDEGKSESLDRRNSIPEITKALDKVALADDAESENSECQNSTPKDTQPLDTIATSDDAGSESSDSRALFKQMKKACIVPFTNSHRAIFRCLQGRSTSTSLPQKDVHATTTKSPESLANNVLHNQKISSSIPPKNSGSRLETRSNRHRPRNESSGWKMGNYSEDIPPKTKEPPDIQLHESSARNARSKKGKSSHPVSRRLRIAKTKTLHPAKVANRKENKVAPSSEEREDQRTVPCHTSSSVKQKRKHSKVSRPDSDKHQPAKDFPTVLPKEVPKMSTLSSSPATYSGPRIGQKKKWKVFDNRRGQQNSQRFSDLCQPSGETNTTHAFQGSTAETLGRNLAPFRPPPTHSKDGPPCKLENFPLTESWTPKNACYPPSENAYYPPSTNAYYPPSEHRQVHEFPPKPDKSLQSRSVSPGNQVKEKHTYCPNPLVIAKWQEVIEQVTGTGY